MTTYKVRSERIKRKNKDPRKRERGKTASS